MFIFWEEGGIHQYWEDASISPPFSWCPCPHVKCVNFKHIQMFPQRGFNVIGNNTIYSYYFRMVLLYIICWKLCWAGDIKYLIVILSCDMQILTACWNVLFLTFDWVDIASWYLPFWITWASGTLTYKVKLKLKCKFLKLFCVTYTKLFIGTFRILNNLITIILALICFYNYLTVSSRCFNIWFK